MSLWSLLDGKDSLIALKFRGNSYRYHDLYTLSFQRAKSWQLHDISPNLRIAIADQDPFEIIISIFACARLNLIFSILPPADQTILQKTIILQDLKPHFSTEQGKLIPQNTSAPLCSPDVSAIFYTSGSSSQPKGVQHSAQNLLTCAKEMAEVLALGKNDSALLILPLSFHYGFSILSSIFQAGGTLCLSEAQFPDQIVQEIQKYQCSILASVPHFWQLLSRVLPKNLPLKKIISAGDSCPKGLLPTLQSQLPDASIHLFYGCTETLRACHHLWKNNDKHAILGQSLPSAILRHSQHGTLEQRGKTIMLGYWNAENPAPSYPQFHDLGDIVEQDSMGNWIFISRSTDIIKSRGYRVSPETIENLLLEAPNILEAIVFQKNGTIEAAIALEEIRNMYSFIAEFPHWLRPKKLHYFHYQLPRSPRKKVSRQWIIRHVLYPRTATENYQPSSSKKYED